MSDFMAFIEANATKPVDWNAAPEIVKSAIWMETLLSPIQKSN